MSETKVIDESKQGEALMVEKPIAPNGKKLFLESYGCAMNFSDSEIVASILKDKGFSTTQDFNEADVIFVNTCAIREGAEQRVRKRLTDFKKAKKNNPDLIVGVLGCMAERLKSQFLEQEKLVDIVVGPDAYRSLPELIEIAETGQNAINVLLSKEETYADIAPVRLGSNGVTAFISITRGCDNMCAFCVVPFTRGRERSRDPETIVKEAQDLFDEGYREVTLLGQNVDSYLWTGGGLKKENVTEEELKNATTFSQLLEKVALVDPDLRVRFSTSHPKDITDEVLFTIAKYDNICNYIHLPVQSGSNRILQLMNRTYTREWYIAKVNRIRELLPGCGLSTDMITGFCTETEEDHRESYQLMEYCKYDLAYMYYYSERPGTLAERRYEDDIPEETKKTRLQEIIALHRIHSLESMQRDVNKTFKVLIEANSKKSDNDWHGRTDHNKVVIFPKEQYGLKKGDYVNVRINSCTAGTLLGIINN